MPSLMRLAGIAVVFAAGCSAPPPARPELVPVTGSVFVDGKPAAGALVTFHPPADASWKAQRAFAIVEPDGTFRGTTFNPGDGVPPGVYRLTVVWAPVLPGRDPEPDALRGKYGDVSKPVAVVTVGPGETKLEPLRLTW